MPTPIKLKQGTNYYQPLCYFPIGYIYLSTSNVNPGTYFGGTWEPIKDRFLLLAGDNYSAGDTGGEAEHKLTIDEMPSHNHNIIRSDGGVANELGWGSNQWDTGYISTSGTNKKNVSQQITHTGGSQAHNNMPPYIVVYGWVKVSN